MERPLEAALVVERLVEDRVAAVDRPLVERPVVDTSAVERLVEDRLNGELLVDEVLVNLFEEILVGDREPDVEIVESVLDALVVAKLIGDELFGVYEVTSSDESKVLGEVPELALKTEVVGELMLDIPVIVLASESMLGTGDRLLNPLEMLGKLTLVGEVIALLRLEQASGQQSDLEDALSRSRNGAYECEKKAILHSHCLSKPCIAR